MHSVGTETVYHMLVTEAVSAGNRESVVLLRFQKNGRLQHPQPRVGDKKPCSTIWEQMLSQADPTMAHQQHAASVQAAKKATKQQEKDKKNASSKLLTMLNGKNENMS